MASPSSPSIESANAVTFNVTRVFRFMRPACEVHEGSELLASMSVSTWRRAGEIVTGDCCYRIARGTMLVFGSQEVATYDITEKFIRFTRVDLVDRASTREFEFRQKRMWCGALVLYESGVPVAEYAPNLFQSSYRVVAKKQTPQSILLLSIWLAVVAGVFNA